MMPTTSCPPAPTPHHQPRCLVSPLWLFLFIALAVFLQDQLSKNSKTTFLKINSGGDQVDPPPTVHNTKFSFLKYIYKWENISVIYIPKKKQKQYCYFIYYLSISRIFSWNWFHGKKFWTSILEYFCTIICEFHHQCRLIYNCCCWCMVCVEKLQTQFNILWYNFFLWWWSSFKNKTKKLLK